MTNNPARSVTYQMFGTVDVEIAETEKKIEDLQLLTTNGLLTEMTYDSMYLLGFIGYYGYSYEKGIVETVMFVFIGVLHLFAIFIHMKQSSRMFPLCEESLKKGISKRYTLYLIRCFVSFLLSMYLFIIGRLDVGCLYLAGLVILMIGIVVSTRLTFEETQKTLVHLRRLGPFN